MPGNEILRQRLQSIAYTVNSHRLLFYALASVSAVVAVVVNALKNYSNFYSVAIYLSKSSRSVLALANFCFLVALLCGHFVQRLFFGPLRANEVERLYDRLWFFITESLLAFTIFRDEFDTSFGFMFGFLLFVKSFHWLASDRIEWMDQRPYPGPPLLFHFRMVVLFCVLWVTDLVMFIFTIEHTLTMGVGGMVLFASEYGILIASIMNTISKYLLSAYELRRAGQRGGENAPPWENKSMWTFYIELATDFMKLSVYLVFFTIILTFYGLPLNIVRDVYITARSFITRLRALHRYQAATRNMDQRYPNASEEELTAMSDRTCIICREEMTFQPVGQPSDTREGPNMTPKKLPCGHIFHFYCLRSWLERQQSCPTCRRTVLDDNPTPPATAPGGAAQPGNPPAPNANRQGGNDNPLGNPLGFVNRIFGPPNFAQNNNPFPQNHAAQNPAVNGVNAPEQGHSPVRIQYEVQYQGQRARRNNQRAPQDLREVPRFPGFGGSNSAGDQRDQPQGHAPNQHNVPSPSSPPTDTSFSPQDDTGSVQQSSSTAVNPCDGARDANEGSNDASDTSGRLSAREAAREAALRRFNSHSSAGLSVSPTPAPTPTTPAAPQATPQSQDQSSTEPTPPVTRARRATSWIPLYDLVFSSDPHDIPSMIRNTGRTEGLGVPPAAGSSSTQSLAESRSLGSIPSHVSQEQLSALDQLTREAIDERLRILEGVSNTVYRCVDDLMRVRSALPPQTPNGVHNASGSHTQSTSSRRDEKRPATSDTN